MDNIYLEEIQKTAAAVKKHPELFRVALVAWRGKIPVLFACQTQIYMACAHRHGAKHRKL